MGGVPAFLSADPNIQAPYSTQSYNRYSYVINNPLKYNDPSGYFWGWIATLIINEVIFDGKYRASLSEGGVCHAFNDVALSIGNGVNRAKVIVVEIAGFVTRVLDGF
jgi:hypothetical protein